MQRHIFAAAVLIFIMSFAVGGFTAAYFTDGITLPLAEFTAGTVEIEVDEVSDGGIIEFNNGYSGTAEWEITNEGTKKAYLRVKVHHELEGEGGGEYGGGETAWAVGYDVNRNTPEDAISPRFGGGNARYHVYTLGHTKENPLQLKLGEGANYICGGTAYIWDDSEKLYIEAQTKNDRRFKETHLYVGSVAPEKHAPGQLGHSHEGIYSIFDNYEIDLPENIVDGKIYIALHADVQELVPGSGGGSGGAIPEISIEPVGKWTKSSDGYYYYNDVVDLDDEVYFRLDFDVYAEEGWSGSCEFWIEAEAVQASHGAINYVWLN